MTTTAGRPARSVTGLWAALVLALGAVALSSGWSGWVGTIMLVTAAVMPIPAFALAAWLRIPTPVTALTVLGLGAAAAYLFVLAPAGPDVAAAVRDSVPRLLTTQRPAPATAALLLPGLATALLVGVWVALRTVSPPSGGRGRGLVAAPAAAVVLYTGGALLTAGTGDRTGALAGAIVAVSAAGWLGLDRFRRVARPTGSARAGLARRARAAAGRPAAVALAGVSALALVVIANPVGAFEPRTLVHPPQRTVSEPSPLPQLAGWHENGDEVLFRVTPTAGEPPSRLRLVTLSAYTGVAWSATATYRPVGVVGSARLPPGRQRGTSAAEFTIAGLEGMWLPGLGQPVDVSVSPVDYEADGGSLVLAQDVLRPGLRYHLRAEHDAPAVEQITTAGVPPGEAAGPLLDVPRLPAAFAEYARRVTFGASTPFEQAVAIEHAVGERRYDPLAPVGSSYARLDTFLFQPEGSQAGAQIGSSEQFAAAFAVLARAVGLPSRVVLGFKGTTSGVVRGRDALAWPEIYFSGYGWYPFDPTPGTADPDVQRVKLQALDRVDEQAQRNAVEPTATAPPAGGPPTVTTDDSGPAADSPVASSAATSVDPLGPVAAAATVILVAIGTLAGLRVARRARHRRAGVRGAWSEVLDLIVLMGQPVPQARTAIDLAADLALAVPVPRADPGAPHPALLIAAAADRAAFAPTDSDGSAQAARAWSALDALGRAVRSAVPLRRRLLWTIDPRPLRRSR